MAVTATDTRAFASPAYRAESETYNLYGLRVRSDVALPLAATHDVADTSPDCEFALVPLFDSQPEPDGPLVAGLPCYGPCHNGSMVITVHRGPGGTWFWYDAVGTCHVAPSGRRVDIYPLPNYDARALSLMLTGQVMTFVLHQQGYPSLHASAVEVDGAGIVFLGPGGHGKSTLAAAFLHRGATLVSDDVLPLHLGDGAVYSLPSLPLMKVWQQTAEHALHLTADLPTLTKQFQKRLLAVDDQFQVQQAPVRLCKIYVLDRYDPEIVQRHDITIERMDGKERLTTLLAQTSNRAYLKPYENAALLPLYARLTAQACISVLRYPHGFAYQDLVYMRIMADLEAGR